MKISFYLFSLSIIISCTNNPTKSEKDELLRKFDSVNQSIEKANNITTSHHYDSLLNILGDGGSAPVRQMYYAVYDFCGYIDDLTRRFIIACGDSTGTSLPENNQDNLSLTNDYFLKKPASLLFSLVKNVKEKFLVVANSDSVKVLINKFASTGSKEWNERNFLELYFKDSPPIAALTILAGFKLNAKTIESLILAEYFKYNK